jgi:hypothetical protein
MITKLFFENISGLLRIFTNKPINFKLIISPVQEENNKKNTKITYHFTTNVLNFPNNIKQIYTKFTFLKKNFEYVYFNNQILNFTLELSDGVAMLSESIYINYKDIINIEINNINKKYNSNKNNDDDDDINELLEFYIKNNNKDNEDNFIFELEK